MKKQAGPAVRPGLFLVARSSAYSTTTLEMEMPLLVTARNT